MTKLTSQASKYGHVVHVTPWGKEHHTQEVDPHTSHSFNDRVEPGDKWDACAVQSQTFILRSHVIGIVGTCANRQTTPQVPRIHRSTFPPRPTAHAQTLKRSPSPLASPEVNKNTLYGGQHHLIQKQVSRMPCHVCDARMTSRPLFFTSIHITKKGYLLPG